MILFLGIVQRRLSLRSTPVHLEFIKIESIQSTQIIKASLSVALSIKQMFFLARCILDVDKEKKTYLTAPKSSRDAL